MIKYPIYVISKGRADLKAHTSRFLLKDNIKHKIVIEPQEKEAYANRFGEENLLILPFSNLGQGSIPARNFCWEHSKNLGYERHWILDDNISKCYKWEKNKRVPLDNSNIAFETVERFTNKFSNLAISGMNYTFLVVAGKNTKPFFHNCHVYSCLLILNSLPFKWRGRYNEDTDLCLQALTNNWCTANINVYTIMKAPTMTCKGGNMAELYQGNGRLKMARSLEFQWRGKLPHGTIKTTFKWNRPQHHVNWGIFKTPLKLKKNIDK